MAKLNDDWHHAFQGSFEDEEDVIEFIFERLNTSDFEDSYINVGGHSGERGEYMKYTADDKRQTLYDFMLSLIEKR